jgi:hypothetical protein
MYLWIQINLIIYILTQQFTHITMEHRSGEANNHSASRAISSLFWDSKDTVLCSQRPTNIFFFCIYEMKEGEMNIM